MPQELLDKLIAAENFNQGFKTTEYLAASLLDQTWHQLNPDRCRQTRWLLKRKRSQGGR